MNDQQLTDLDLDEIAARAAGLYEYATDLDDAWQAEVDRLSGSDVPALLAEVRRLRAQVAAVTDLCDQQEMAARMFELPTPEWITAVRNATAPTARSAAV